MVLTDQLVVLRRVEQVVAGEEWRQDRRAAWVAILRRLVYSMDRETGLVTGVPACTLAAAGGRAERTVTDVIRWAKDVGLLFTVEEGAAGSFLGSRVNRTPTYAFLTHRTATTELPDQGSNQKRDELCDLSQSYVGKKPSREIERRRKPRPHPWPGWRVPETPAERKLAADTLLDRIGPNLPKKRVYGLLLGWWQTGWCVNGLLYAIDHHPDTHAALGNAGSGARDPLATIGARLRSWKQRTDALPEQLHGLRGDYQLEQVRRLAERITDRDQQPPAGPRRAQPASAEHRAAVRAAFAAHRTNPQTERTTPTPS
jgi:hypothetical protein